LVPRKAAPPPLELPLPMPGWGGPPLACFFGCAMGTVPWSLIFIDLLAAPELFGMAPRNLPGLALAMTFFPLLGFFLFLGFFLLLLFLRFASLAQGNGNCLFLFVAFFTQSPNVSRNRFLRATLF
jgi:hypothetical protein